MKGFTLVEILIVIGITLILAAAATPLYTTFQVSAQLNETTAQTIQTLRLARQRSAIRFNNASHGVYFEISPSTQDKVILYQGDSYATRDSALDRITILDTPISISTTFGGEVNFAAGTGIPDVTGTLNIIHAVSGLRTIRINSLGMIEE